MRANNVWRSLAVCGAATVIGVAGVQVASAELTAPAGPTTTTVDAAKTGDGADAGQRGPRGKRGKRGSPGPRGPIGPIGLTGPAGPSLIPITGVSLGGIQAGAQRIFFPGGNLGDEDGGGDIGADLSGGFASAPVHLVIQNFRLTRPSGAAFQGPADYYLVVDTDGDPGNGLPGPGSNVCHLNGSAAVESCTIPGTIDIPAGSIYYFLVPAGGGFGPGSYFSYTLSAV